MSEAIKVLDHGYVRFIEAWGHGDAGNANEGTPAAYYDNIDMECGIIEAARQSTQASFRGWNEDQKLLAYLFNGKPQHATPFEFAGMVIEVQAPIFVYREWHRHRTQSYNEMSARYAPLPNINYVPEWDVLKTRGENAEKTRNTQEKGQSPWNELTSKEWHRRLPEVYEYLEKVYNDALLSGVPKEIARIVLPVGRYSRMRASANLRNWLAFMTLRADPNAQWEIREYANAVGTIIAEKFPRTWELYKNRV